MSEDLDMIVHNLKIDIQNHFKNVETITKKCMEAIFELEQKLTKLNDEIKKLKGNRNAA